MLYTSGSGATGCDIALGCGNYRSCNSTAAEGASLACACEISLFPIVIYSTMESTNRQNRGEEIGQRLSHLNESLGDLADRLTGLLGAIQSFDDDLGLPKFPASESLISALPRSQENNDICAICTEQKSGVRVVLP